MRKDYLRILGLNEAATKEEIKKAWKKKTLQFHPDKNPNKNAQEEFIKICNAYEKLSTNNFIEIESTLPKSSQEFYKKYNKNLTPEELKVRLQKAREHARYKAMYEENIHSISFTELKNTFIYKFSNIVALFSILIGSLLLVDYSILEPTVEKAVILTHRLNGDDIIYKVYDLNYQLPTEEREYEISTSIRSHNFTHIPYNSFVLIYKSRILNENISFSGFQQTFKKSMSNKKSIYIAFWVFMIIFYLPLINFIARGPNTVYLIFIHVNAYLPIFALMGLLIGLT